MCALSVKRVVQGETVDSAETTCNSDVFGKIIFFLMSCWLSGAVPTKFYFIYYSYFLSKLGLFSVSTKAANKPLQQFFSFWGLVCKAFEMYDVTLAFQHINEMFFSALWSVIVSKCLYIFIKCMPVFSYMIISYSFNLFDTPKCQMLHDAFLNTKGYRSFFWILMCLNNSEFLLF